MAVRHRDVVLAHMKELGLRLNARKVCLSSIENHLSGCGVGSDHDAGTYVPCSDRVNPHVSQESERRPVTHCQAVSKTAGSDVSCVQRKTKGFSPRGNTLCMIKVTQRCLCALDMWRKPLVLVSGPGAGSSLSPCNANDGCIPHRLGSSHEWPPCVRSVEWSPSHVAHQLPGDAGCVSSTQTISCVGTSRHPVEAGAEALEMDASTWSGEADMESLSQAQVDLFATCQN